MGRISIRLLLLLTIVTTAACLIKPPEPIPEPFTKLEDYVNNTNIRVLHATPNELYILSDDEFARLDLNNELVEKRRLEIPFEFSARSAVSDHNFYQLILNDSLDLEINFHLTKNPDEVEKIKLKNLMQAGDSGFIKEGNNRNIGAFNDNGTQFLIPVIRVPGSYYSFFLFDINLNGTNTNFQSVELAHRIDIDGIPASAGNLNSVKYIDGFFYATSLFGAVRINPTNGSYTQIFDDWMLDFFKYDDKLYATGFGNALYVSNDNGLNFTVVDLSNVDTPFPIEMIQIVNDKILSQQAIGFPFSIIDTDFESGKLLLLNSDFTQDFSAYQDIEYFNGKYYLPVFKELYTSPDLFIED